MNPEPASAGGTSKPVPPLRGPDSYNALTQGFRPGLTSIPPFGLWRLARHITERRRRNALLSPGDSGFFSPPPSVETVGYHLRARGAGIVPLRPSGAVPQRKSFAPQAACPTPSAALGAGSCPLRLRTGWGDGHLYATVSAQSTHKRRSVLGQNYRGVSARNQLGVRTLQPRSRGPHYAPSEPALSEVEGRVMGWWRGGIAVSQDPSAALRAGYAGAESWVGRFYDSRAGFSRRHKKPAAPKGLGFL